MPTFDQRLGLSAKIEQNLQQLFQRETAVISEFGCGRIAGDNAALLDYLKTPAVNQLAPAMIVKFAPDFILLKNSEPKRIYFLDVKYSVAPTWAQSRLEMLQKRNSDTTLSAARIGVVAREALLSYRRYYPGTIILFACPYNPKLLMAQFANRVRCLYCYRSPGRGEYDCGNCPAKNGGFFDIERATKSIGSQTPMTNVDLNSFMPADVFFDRLGIRLDSTVFARLKQEIKSEKLMFGSSVYPKQKKRVLENLIQSGCDWIDLEKYSH